MRIRSWWALLALALLLLFVPWPKQVARGLYLGLLYPAWSAMTSRLADAVVPSLSAVTLIALLATPTLITAALRLPVARLLRFWGGVALVLLLAFPLTFGLGYRLPPLEELPQLAGRQVAPGSVQHAIARALVALDAAAPDVDSASLAAPQAVAAASHCVARLTGGLRGGPPPSLPARVKALPPGLLLRFGFAGVVSPWLLEPHVDAGLPPAAALAVALHEFAHTAGFASEASAEAVGLAAGLRCHDPAVVYAAALRLVSGVAAGLPPAEREEFRAALPSRALADLRASARASARFSSSAAPGAAAAYDLYLRSQGESGGVSEYDRGTELALWLLAALDG